ncbi:MAG TPA: M43 family zinc metalloprotease [Bacteroidales bacterium]|nr:M43 family zinc metalloprotease [Bacteroidales bacterium]
MKAWILFITLTVVHFNITAQWCGTTVLANQIQLESTLSIPALTPTQGLPKVNRNLSVAFYVVLDSLKRAGVTTNQIDDAIARLNTEFSPIGLQFHICSVNYVENYQFDNIQAGGNENALTLSNSTKDVINIYLATAVFDPFKNAVKGYTYMPASSRNYIFLTKYFIEGSELSHQLGHFFNLYHTHETAFGREDVARDNCDKAGDLCCDTEADPNIFGMVNADCLFSDESLKDPKGALYNPSSKNIMSYSSDICRCYFSKMQYQRIAHAVLHLKTNLK